MNDPRGAYAPVPSHDAVSNAKSSKAQQIADDRYRLLIFLGSFIVAVLMAVALGISISEYRDSHIYKGREVIIHELSKNILFLMREGLYSANYVQTDLSTVTDRDQVRYLLDMQEATRNAFIASETARLDVCSSCPSVMEMFAYPQLLYMQNKVTQRAVTASDAFMYYVDAVHNLCTVISYYTGFSVDSGLVNALWIGDLLSAARAVSTIGGGLIDLKNNPSNAEQGVQIQSVASTVLRKVQSSASLTTTTDANIEGAFLSTIATPNSVLGSFFAGVTGDFTNLQTTGGIGADEVVVKVFLWYEDILNRVESTEPWKDMVYHTWLQVLILAIVVVVLSAVVMVFALRDATAIVWAADDEMQKMQAVHRLEQSLGRMELFVDCILNMDPIGVRTVASLTAETSMSTAAERELMLLEPPIRRVLSFVSPMVLAACRRDPADPNMLAANPNMMGPTTQIQDGPDGLMAEMNEWGDNVELVFHLESMCLVLVDLSCFNGDITSEAAKVVPKDITVCINELAGLAEEYKGLLLYVSGTIAVLAWNAMEKVEEPENAACHMLLRMKQGMLANYPSIRCAVVSGICPHGVVGSSKLRAYAVIGPLIALGRLALQIARLHGVRTVIDKSTFLRLDTQRFRKRILEKVATDFKNNIVINETTIYEMNAAGEEPNEYYLLWNAAFDNYLTGHYDEAGEKLRQWRKRFGEHATYARVMRMISERPEPRSCTYKQTTGVGFDHHLFLK